MSGENEARSSQDCGRIWFDADFWFGAAAVAGIGLAFLLNQAITMAGRRKRNTRNKNWKTNLVSFLSTNQS